MAAVAVAVAVAAGLLVATASRSRGYTGHQVSPNDGGIWVTSDHDGLFGRLNTPVGALDAAFFPPGGRQLNYQLDVIQSGFDVVARDRASGKLYPVDVAAGTPIAEHGISVNSADQVQVGGGSVAVLDPASGKLWASRDGAQGIATMAGLDANSRPLAVIGSPSAAGSALTVGVDGSVYAVSGDGRLAVLRPTADGTGFGKVRYQQLDVALQSVQLTAVGSRQVVLDAKVGTVLLPGGKVVTLPGGQGDPVLQQPSAGGQDVFIATSNSLFSVNLSDGRVSDRGDLGSGPAAAPVELDGCVYAAWTGTPGVAARDCDGRLGTIALAAQTALVKPELRSNSDAVALNDLTSGAVWDLATGKRVDNWQQVSPPATAKPQHKPNQQDSNSDRTLRKPRVVADDLGARPGHTAILHVLDNDSDPSGNILSIRSLTAPSNPDDTLAISPDGQTVQITMSPNSADVRFSYTVDDGKGLEASAAVTVHARQPGDNKPPNLRAGFSPHVWTVAYGGAVTLPVLGDWRDYDGDPPILVKASASAGTVSTTADGRLNYTAPLTAGPQQLKYTVSDGTAAAEAVLNVDVLAATATGTVPATTEPDVGRGQAGQPIVLNPLDNDLPGADPSTPTARLQLATDVASPDGTTVVTNRKAGTVTLTAAHAGTYLFSYTAAYGNAAYAKGTARVDVVAAPSKNLPPVAVLDAVTLHGQGAAIVDVLANDYDPAGNLLTVQQAGPADSSQLQVAIIAGHWLRIDALVPAIGPNPQVVRYTITDGVTGSVTGEVSVSQLPAPQDDTPVPQDDYATVRAGDSVSIPVLDNDTDPGGDPLSLNPDSVGAPRPGELAVSSAEGGHQDTGNAYLAGNLIRYAAPASIAGELTFTIDYPVQNDRGEQAIGHAYVTVEPPPSASRPDQAPAPPAIQARVVAGDTITVPVATTGTDPDGDSVTLTGIASAPARGRVLASNASSLTYQAYPTSSGTDDFSYTVLDRYGKSGTAAIRVSVVPPGDPQPPVAADDVLTAAPGKRISVDVLANDYRAVDDKVTIRPLARDNRRLAGAASLESPTGPLDVTVGSGAAPVVLRYAITDGLGQPSVATVTVRGRPKYDIPPVALDAYASPGAEDNLVSVDVLARDSDPDGDAADLTVSRVFAAKATVSGGKVSLPVLDHPQVVPFEVTDGGGAVSMATVFVPASGAGAPFVKPDQLIDLPQNGARTIDVRDYLLDPARKPVSLTTTGQLWTSPSAQLTGTEASNHLIRLTAARDYTGPAALTFQVTDGVSLTDPKGQFAIVTIPVQIGPPTPVLRCPTSPITVIEGGADVDLDISSLCHVWVADPGILSSIRYQGSIKAQQPGIGVGNADPRTLRVNAAGSAVPGSTGQLSVTVPGTPAVPAQLQIVVAVAPRPTMSPVTLGGVVAGRPTTVDITDYVNSQLRDPVVSVVRVSQTSGTSAGHDSSGSSITLTPPSDAHGSLSFAVTVSDVADSTRTDRYATGTITLQVLGVPDVPGVPIPERSAQSHVVSLSWSAPANNGEPIDYYEIDYPGGSRDCPGSPCAIDKLTNGTAYRFTVRAHNGIGFGKLSGQSEPATPNAVPGAVLGLATSQPRDRTLTLAWQPAPVDGTPVTGYSVSWPGGHTSTSATETVVTGLDNEAITTFTVIASNAKGQGPASTVTGQSAGAPKAPDTPNLTATMSSDQVGRTETVAWNAVSPNGPGPTSYTVSRSGGGQAKTVCAAVTGTTCTDDQLDNDGTTYSYRVTAANAEAANAAGHVSPASSPASVTAAATPGPLRNVSASPTGQDRQVKLTFDAPPAHGHQLTIRCSVDGDACQPGQWQFPPECEDGATRTITLPSDGGQSAQITLKACNDAQIADPCSDPVTVSSDPAFGHLGPVDVTVTGVDGPFISYTVTARPNGKAAQLKVTVKALDGTTLDSRSDTTDASPDTWTKTYRSEVGFGKQVTIKATVTDSDRPKDHPSGQATGQTNAGTATPSRGATSTANPACQTAACAQIHLVLGNLGASRSVSCHFTVNGQASASLPDLSVATDGSGNYNADLPAPTYVFGTAGATLAVQCGDSTATVSGSVSWPSS